MEKTLFEKILDGEIPAKKIYEDEHTLVILDAFPVSPGHLLVLPKKERVTSIIQLSEDARNAFFLTVSKMNQHLREVLACEGVNMLVNDQEAAGPHVVFLHLHLIPRWKNDGVDVRVQSLFKSSEDQLLRIQKKLQL